jgi:predicted NBD/HSP70 family sugar kinase
MTTLGVDLTGALRVVIVDDSGTVTSREQGGPHEDLLKRVTRKTRVEAVGVAVADNRDPKIGVAGAPVTRCSPGAASVAAEAWIGMAKGARHAVCLNIGEHVFAGILLDGRPWIGAHNRAGDAAWLALNPVERQDYRKLGGLAAEVGFKGIARRLSWRVQAGDDSAVLERAGALESITAAHVFEGARNGDGVAISVVRDTAKYLAMAVANLAAMVDPEVVVIGGEIAMAKDLLLEPVMQDCARRLPASTMEALRIGFSELGDDAVAIGAARLAMPA